MLNRKYQKLRSKCKGNLRICHYSLYSIPVLSVFAFLGILSHSLASINSTSAIEPEISDTNPSPLTNTAALSITSGPADTAATTAGRGTTTYRTYTISITSDNVESYNLAIYGNSELSHNTTDKLTSANGAQGNNLPADTWGYAFEELANNTSAGSDNDALTYTAPLANNVATNLISSRIVNGALTNYGKLVFAAKFGEDLPEGNYKANITLALTVTPRELITYTINYNANGGSNAPNTQSTTTYDKSANFTIPSTTPTRNGYTFLGWHTNNASTSADINYSPGKTVTLTSANQTLNLYAIWQAKLTLNDITEMQQITADICTNTSSGTTTTLKDTRDSSSYTIRKHEDGKCWMTQNLRLVGNRTLTSSDSSVGSNFTLPASNLSSFTNDQTVNSVYYSGNTSYGAYYSWTAATAGTRSRSYSICPRGWRLPSTTDYSNLITAVGAGTSTDASIIFRNNTYQFTLAGHISGGDISETTVFGDYWTSDAYSTSRAKQFRISTSAVSTSHNSNYYRGLSVRCVVN